MISIEKKGSSVEQAIELCLEELKLSKDEVDIEVISSGGIFSKAVVKATKKETIEDKALSYVSGLLSKMSLDCAAEIVSDEEGRKSINIFGKDNGMAIGYRGEVLDAIQYITMLAINRDRAAGPEQEYAKISINSESYREKRAATLTELANRLASKVARSGRAVELEPMNPFERRIVHTALQNSDKVLTESTGVDPRRYIVIKPKADVQFNKSNNRPYQGNNNNSNNNFKRNGPGKTRSFGGKTRKTF